MRHQHLSSSTTTTMSPSSPNYPSSSTTSYCKHSSPTATTLDLLILILVLFSGSFLLNSYLSYIINSLSLLLPHLSPTHLFYLLFTLSFIATLTLAEICCLPRSRKCPKMGCKGLKNCLEFDLQLIKEGSLRSSGCSGGAKKGDWSVEEIEGLPWKGGSEGNPDYECLRAELRKMAPVNGKAVLLFRAKCGCPLAKLEGLGPKRGRRLKKSSALNGGGDHR